MVGISIEKFADMTAKANKDINKKELIEDLKVTRLAKKNGAKCMVCGSPIWAVGSAVTGSYMCFTCMTLESDDSEDYEIE
jgi:formamidopyrimidine-DNA glycosylase